MIRIRPRGHRPAHSHGARPQADSTTGRSFPKEWRPPWHRRSHSTPETRWPGHHPSSEPPFLPCADEPGPPGTSGRAPGSWACQLTAPHAALAAGGGRHRSRRTRRPDGENAGNTPLEHETVLSTRRQEFQAEEAGRKLPARKGLPTEVTPDAMLALESWGARARPGGKACAHRRCSAPRPAGPVRGVPGCQAESATHHTRPLQDTWGQLQQDVSAALGRAAGD